MKQDPKLILAVLAIALNAPGAFAQLLPAGPGDLIGPNVVSQPPFAALKSSLDIPREAVSLSWSLDASTNLESSPAPFVAHSREYFVEVSAADLRQGVPVYTTSPGALVRLNPVAEDTRFDQKIAIAPASLVLVTPAGASFSAGSGMDQMAGPAELKAAGAPFAEGTSAFRIREELGAGAFELRADGLTASEQRYVMHVFDRQSSTELRLRTTATDYLHGQTLTVEATLADSATGASASGAATPGDRKFRGRKLDGFVTSPGGRAWPLTFQHAGRGTYRATLLLDALEAPAPGLWQVHASAQARRGGQAILRAGKTAFACTLPSARLSGTAEVVSDRDSVRVDLGVEVASASRYEARAVLYATANDGSLQPAGITHSAAWLEAGAAELSLDFNSELLAGKALGAPFELRDLRLVDQVKMGLLHRQAHALNIDR